MSEDSFKASKSDLSFSQALLDQLRGQNMAQQQAQMPQDDMVEEEVIEEPEEVSQRNEEEPQEENQEESKIVQMFQSFMKEMRGLFQKDLQEDKKLEAKVDELVAEESKDETTRTS